MLRKIVPHYFVCENDNKPLITVRMIEEEVGISKEKIEYLT
jgi:hypothetical protein